MLERLKAAKAETVDLWMGEGGGGGYYYPFKVGRRYLVFVNNYDHSESGESPILEANVCGMTQEFPAATEALTVVRALTAGGAR